MSKEVREAAARARIYDAAWKRATSGAGNDLRNEVAGAIAAALSEAVRLAVEARDKEWCYAHGWREGAFDADGKPFTPERHAEIMQEAIKTAGEGVEEAVGMAVDVEQAKIQLLLRERSIVLQAVNDAMADPSWVILANHGWETLKRWANGEALKIRARSVAKTMSRHFPGDGCSPPHRHAMNGADTDIHEPCPSCARGDELVRFNDGTVGHEVWMGQEKRYSMMFQCHRGTPPETGEK